MVIEGRTLLRIEEVTDLLSRYERTRQLERLYVTRADRERARCVLGEPHEAVSGPLGPGSESSL